MDDSDDDRPKSNETSRGRKFERLVNAHCQISASRPVGDEIGFLCSSFIQFTLPHRAMSEHVLDRRNGNLQVTFVAPPGIGLPYGKWVRLLLIHLTTQARRTKKREIDLGQSISALLKLLCASVSGGRNGSIQPFKRQLLRTTSLTASVSQVPDVRGRVQNAPLAGDLKISWDVVDTDGRSGLPTTLRLGEGIFDQMLRSAVPLDMRAVQAVQQSPMALDIYAWSTYRAPRVAPTHAARIEWADLQAQFGSDYAAQSDFKIAFCSALRQVQMVYPCLRVEVTGSHLLVWKSPPSVPRNVKPAGPSSFSVESNNHNG